MTLVIRVLSLLIMTAAATTSYRTQRELFLQWDLDEFTASVAPVSVDLLAILCTFALHHPRYTRGGKAVAAVVLVLVGGGSVAANYAAGETTGARVVHAAMVGLYLLAEWVASQKILDRPKPAPVVADTGPERSTPADTSGPVSVAPVAPAPAASAPAQRTPIEEFVARNGRPPSKRHAQRLAGLR